MKLNVEFWMDERFFRNDELGDDENESHIFEWKCMLMDKIIHLHWSKLY
jgi:hypothetical protein